LVSSSHPSSSHSHSPAPSTDQVYASGSTEAILSLLGISPHLGDRSDHSLQGSYKKYKAYLEACDNYERMVGDGVWVGQKLTATGLIELFGSKSFWHSHVKKLFSQVSNHPLMVEWLDNSEDKPSNLDVWGVEKTSYTFKDLKEYLEQAKAKGKGRGKNKAKVEDKDRKGKKDHKKAKKQAK
jgi:hypothetical protein